MELATIISLAFAVLVAALLSVWAHLAQKNRRLAVAIYVVFGFVAVTALGLGILTALVAPVVELGGAVTDIVAILILFGLAVGSPIIPQVRRLLGGLMPFDPGSIPDMVGLIAILGTTVLNGVTGFLLGEDLEVVPVGWVELVAQAAAFVFIAYLAVGLFITRDIRSATARLGLHRLTVRQVGIAVGLVVVAFVIAGVAGAVTQALQPELEQEIAERSGVLTEQVASVPGALVLGLSAGIGEEILFRGAIQPRFGLVFTALVFASFHVQYGLSFIVVGVFLLGVMLGLERRRLGTTASILTHALYNFLAVMLSLL